MLLLHGSGPGVTALANWRPVIPALSAARRVIAPDQLGFGGTATGEPRRFGRAAWTEHALALLDALGVPAVDIIGNSMGGAIALSMAAARPAAVRRVVLMGSMGVAMALPSGLDTVWGYTPGVPQMREVIGLFAHNRALITDDLVELRYQASLHPPVRDSWAAMFPPPRQRWVDDLALSGAELAAIGVPVLLVHGRDDRVVPWRESSAQLVDLLRGLAATRAVRLRPLDHDREDGRLPGRRPALPVRRRRLTGPALSRAGQSGRSRSAPPPARSRARSRPAPAARCAPGGGRPR